MNKNKNRKNINKVLIAHGVMYKHTHTREDVESRCKKLHSKYPISFKGEILDLTEYQNHVFKMLSYMLIGVEYHKGLEEIVDMME